MRVWHPRAPALRLSRPSPFHRRARACPSPCLDLHGKRRWSACGFRAGRTIAGDRPPRYGIVRVSESKNIPFHVGRGPVPRHASIFRATALVGVWFSRRSNDRGGQAPARRLSRPSPFCVGRGPVPRHASVVETALVGVRFSRRSNDRGGNPLGCACGIRGPPRDGCRGRLHSRRARACHRDGERFMKRPHITQGANDESIKRKSCHCYGCRSERRS